LIEVLWEPTGLAKGKVWRAVPSLLHLTVDMLCDNIDGVESLVSMPDAPRALITRRLCEQRQLSPEVLRLFTEGSPAEVVLPDCGQLGELELTPAVSTCLGPNLRVLSLGYCGRGFTDKAAANTLGMANTLEGAAPNLDQLALMVGQMFLE
jgi:hypothetical protein